MSNDINLLHAKKKSVLSDLNTKLRILRFGALGLLSLVVLLSMALFFLVLASPLESLKEEESELLTSLSVHQEQVARHTLLTSRLRDIQVITNKRMNIQGTIQLFRAVAPEDVTIQTVEIEENIVRIQATSLSLESLQTYVSSLSSYITEAKVIDLLKVNSILLTNEGFILDVTATLP